MKLFKTTQKNFAMIGITPELVTQSYPINWKICMGFLILGSAFISAFAYVFNYADTFFEYTQSIFIGFVVAFAISILLIPILKVEKLFEMINRFDSISNMSKRKSDDITHHSSLFRYFFSVRILGLKYSATRSIYEETSQFEEKLSGIILFAMVKITPMCIFVSYFIYIFFVYFTTDLGADAFELPCPMW